MEAQPLEPRKILTKEEIIKILDELSTLPDFEKLPLPQCYLDHKGISEDEYYKPKTLRNIIEQEMTKSDQTRDRLKKKLESRNK